MLATLSCSSHSYTRTHCLLVTRHQTLFFTHDSVEITCQQDQQPFIFYLAVKSALNISIIQSRAEGRRLSARSFLILSAGSEDSYCKQSSVLYNLCIILLYHSILVLHNQFERINKNFDQVNTLTLCRHSRVLPVMTRHSYIKYFIQ